MKALIICHRHPDYFVGGAEIAAYNHFRGLQRRDDVEEASFLARTDRKSMEPGQIRFHRDGEYLWRQDMSDWFYLRTKYPDAITSTFREFLQSKSLDVIYVHHIADIGVEILREIRRTLPKCLLVMVFHEFIPICNRFGQMLKAKSNRLCWRESVDNCHMCFPEYRPEDFWLRKHYVQRHLEMCDYFVAPSHFLKSRYIEWGIPESHITVIENGQPDWKIEDATARKPGQRVRFGFFGQITPFKGLDILLQALHICAPDVRRKISVVINGANLELQPEEHRTAIEKLRAPLVQEGTLQWVGGYENMELARRMSKVDWVVVPSIWWENSPMVIQEAFCARRPVICGNVGGMAEKVQHDVTGLHYEIRNPVDLADAITRAATEPGLWERLQANIRQPISYDECVDEYLRVGAE